MINPVFGLTLVDSENKIFSVLLFLQSVVLYVLCYGKQPQGGPDAPSMVQLLGKFRNMFSINIFLVNKCDFLFVHINIKLKVREKYILKGSLTLMALHTNGFS